MSRLQYRINPNKQSAATGSAPNGQPVVPMPGAPPRSGNPFVIPGVTRPRIPSNLDTRYTFDNFIEGDCNSLARNAAKAVADNPTNTAFNPLVIHGNVGLGKTHLLQAVGNYISTKFPNKAVLYVSTDTFTNQLVSSIGSNTTNDLVNWYQNVDVLLVEWGLSADLSIPALETRMAILNSKASNNEVVIPSDVAEFICFHIQNNIRQLEGVLNNLVLNKGVLGREHIDLTLAKQVLKNFVTEINKEVTPEVIQRTVADYYDLEVEKLASATRRRQVVLARQISMFLVKEYTDQSLKAIGRMFGRSKRHLLNWSVRSESGRGRESWFNLSYYSGSVKS